MRSEMFFLIDEDLPRSTAKALTLAGYQALDVRDVGLRGAKDLEILNYARMKRAAIVTADVGFSSLAYLSAEEHWGLILLRLLDGFSIQDLQTVLLRGLKRLSIHDVTNNIVVVDPVKVRIRRRNKAQS